MSMDMFLSHSRLFSLLFSQLDQIGWISVAAWLNRNQRRQRGHKSITSPLPFHQLSLSLFVSVAFSSFFNPSALLSSSSSLSFECHSTLPSYSNMLLLIKNQVPSLSKTDALPPQFFSWKAQMPTPLPSISSICGVRLLEPCKTF